MITVCRLLINVIRYVIYRPFWVTEDISQRPSNIIRSNIESDGTINIEDSITVRDNSEILSTVEQQCTDEPGNSMVRCQSPCLR